MDIKSIKRDPLIIKFCFYGFFKNLKFFEPYLVYYFMTLNLSLFQIGWLYAIREAMTYIFEIPSGVFADSYGKKTELKICFVFYMLSFVCFSMGTKFIVLAIGMVLFGLGEAFRSGTHKAIIMSYLDEQNWTKYKTFVYGRTRSFSLLGSAISAIVSIFMILYVPLNQLFFICIIPYAIDFALIASYPERFNERHVHVFSVKDFVKEMRDQIKEIKGKSDLKRIIASSAIFDGIFKLLKDYIQPMMKTLIVAGAISSLDRLDADMQVKFALGIVYGVTYLLSAVASRNVYRITEKYSSIGLMNSLFNLFGICIIAMGAGLKDGKFIWVIILYLLTYIFQNARRPAFVDVIGDHLEKRQRATVLSVESQMKALVMIIMAPILGFVADIYGLVFLFIGLGVLLLVLNRMINLGSVYKNNE
ncbi:MAG: MFS transporter [Tissierellales bacterium]|jgi:MFS family permease|nr:MFS transporter [Tissierellales bacterium]